MPNYHLKDKESYKPAIIEAKIKNYWRRIIVENQQCQLLTFSTSFSRYSDLDFPQNLDVWLEDLHSSQVLYLAVRNSLKFSYEIKVINTMNYMVPQNQILIVFLNFPLPLALNIYFAFQDNKLYGFSQCATYFILLSSIFARLTLVHQFLSAIKVQFKKAAFPMIIVSKVISPFFCNIPLPHTFLLSF